MADGVVDIPLPGKFRESDSAEREPSGHFFAGPENRLVEVAVRSVVQHKPHCYNPLVLYGPSGTGKSYLARGLAAAWKDQRHRPTTDVVGNDGGESPRRHRVVCTTAVDFARELADAIETQGIEEFREKYRMATLLVIEDLGQLATRKSGKISAQEELIHTLDALVAEDCWVIVTASAAPAELPGLLPALQSRLAAGLTIPLLPPGPDARLSALRQLAADRETSLSDPVASLLADGLSGTVPELAGMLLQLEMPSRLGGCEIDACVARRFLADKKRSRQPTLHEIAAATARHFSLKLADLRSSARRRALVVARGVAIYLARLLTDESLEQIGAYFGGRDHTTVMHGYSRIESLLTTDPAVAESVESLRKILGKT